MRPLAAPLAPALALFLALAASGPRAAVAQPAPPAPRDVRVPAGHGQLGLSVRVSTAGLTAAACPGAACAPEQGKPVAVPEEARQFLGGAKLATIELADGKHLVRVEAENGAGATWVALLAGPLAGKASDGEPAVLWSGWTGLRKGELGEGRSFAVVEEPLAAAGGAAKKVRVLVGARREDVTVCGRPALIAAREVDPATLSLVRGATVQNLPAEERAGATRLEATKLGQALPAPAVPLLRATTASSAVDKKIGTLTDGDPETVWSEDKGHGGRGEFVTMSSSSDVGITSLEIAVRPASAEVADGAAPRVLYLASPEKLFSIALPEDGWKKGGSRYEVKLPEPLRASCLALVVESSYAPASAAEARVTLAEVTAHTAFDGSPVEGLVGALAGGGARAEGAAALLERGGAAAVHAVVAGYEQLDLAGRLLAVGVVDGAPCSEQVPFFAARLLAVTSAAPVRPGAGVRLAPLDDADPELAHAVDRLRRCGRASAPALAKLVVEGPPRTREAAANELAIDAPAEAVPVLLGALAKADDETRQGLRRALSQAATKDRAIPALAEAVRPDAFRALPEVVQIDLLRSVGPSLGRVDGSAQAFGALAVPGASFRTRYLLEAPAADLARAGDTSAAAFLRDSLRKDPDPQVRRRAAQASLGVVAMTPELLAAIDDPEVRVREAAMASLSAAPSGGAPPAGLETALLRRLATDDWPFVRSGAATALAGLPADPAADRALAVALADRSAEVRGRALDALGAHKARGYASALRDRMQDTEEPPEVRARAILALGSMCDARSLDDFTKRALRAKSPADETDRRLGSAAVAALGRAHPKDLAERLGPLLEKDAPPAVREMAKAALEEKGSCP